MGNIHEAKKISSIETNTFKQGKSVPSQTKMLNKMSSPNNKKKGGGINRRPNSN